MSQEAYFNIAELVCRRHHDAIYRIALEEVRCAGTNVYSFGGLDYLSDKFANILKANGINLGDVVAVLLPQSATFLVAHFGILKLGAIVAPLPLSSDSTSFRNATKANKIRAIVIDEALLSEFEGELTIQQDVQAFIATDYASKHTFKNGQKGFWYEINFADADFKIAETNRESPAYIYFDNPEESLMRANTFTHGFILDRLFEAETSAQLPFIKDTGVQTKDDWSSIPTLTKILFPTLYCGFSIVTDWNSKVIYS
jgi:acetyl-CoA synthetase